MRVGCLGTRTAPTVDGAAEFEQADQATVDGVSVAVGSVRPYEQIMLTLAVFCRGGANRLSWFNPSIAHQSSCWS